MKAKPWFLPRLDEENVRLFNRLAAGRPLLPLALGEEEILLRPDFPGSLEPAPAGEWDLELTLSLDNEPWRMAATSRAFSRLLPLPEKISPAELPEELRLALYEVCLEPWLAALAERLACEATLLALHMPGLPDAGARPAAEQGDGVRLCFTLCDRQGLDLGSGELLFPRSDHALALWRRAVRAFPRMRDDVSALALPLSLSAADGHFSLALLKDVAAGDILCFPSPGLLADMLTLESGGRALWWATLSDGVVTVTGPVSSPAANEVTMQEESPSPDPQKAQAASEGAPEAAGTPRGDLDSLELRLCLELEERLISVGELAAIAPGHTFVTGADTRAPVALKINGKTVGRGKLVDVDGRIGVMVAEFRLPSLDD
ncbi:FliM/FliN family flagellar motor switch protein [Desulfovibrio sp. OttesenSCG-928-G11]|nr:FliM/FliN family flagellar motor switch protein [Desulfovibrio sp. OttesenSCG-928-G11]